MKRSFVAGGLFGLLAGLGLPGASAAFAATLHTAGNIANIPDGTHSISLVGFCNVIVLVKPGAAGAPGVQATDNGCATLHTLIGASAAGAVGMGWSDVGNLYIVINGDRTWTNYMDCGVGTQCVLNSGTWTLANGPARRGLPDATSVGSTPFGEGAQDLPAPGPISVNISFDGFCDGEYLNVPGSAGAPGVDGTGTGCSAGPLIGAYFYHPNFVGIWDYAGPRYYFIQANHTWILYFDCGGGVSCLGNSGTWSFGAPAAPDGKATAIPSSLRH